MQPVIEVRDVVNRFGSQTVHDGVSFDVFPGEIFGVVGGSGTGKSVLLRTILGLRQPTSGSDRAEGVDVTRADDDQQRDRRCLAVEPDANDGAVEDQPHDRILGQ